MTIGDMELPPFLGNYRSVDLRGKLGDEREALLEMIANKLLGKRPGPPGRKAPQIL